jgi:hypothetical protein
MGFPKVAALAVICLLAGILYFKKWNYAYQPPESKVVSYTPHTDIPAYDVWGEAISKEQAADLEMTEEGSRKLASENGAVRIDAALLKRGRRAFYTEVFANVPDSPVLWIAVAGAVLKLRGAGTTDLKISLPEGQTVSTGLDVAAGSLVPLGVQMEFHRGRLRFGITCAACHASVDSRYQVLEGVPNRDFQAGLLFAQGRSWPPGYFDFTQDGQNNPVQIPDIFVRGEYPYGWTGEAGVGPFRGLSAMNHAGYFEDPGILSPAGNLIRGPESPEWSFRNALAAWQMTLRPPDSPYQADPERMLEGRTIFEKATCVTCHDGDYLTNNRIIPAEQIRTEPARALANAQIKHDFESAAAPKIEGQDALEVPVTPDQLNQARLAWAQEGHGGYKVPGLRGVRLTAPYLHDGGVPDFRVLLDRKLRKKVIGLNRQSPSLRQAHITGEGHEFWIDEEAGYTPGEREAVIAYLMSL